MSKKIKKSNQDERVEKIILITSLIKLIEVLIELINKLLEQ